MNCFERFEAVLNNEKTDKVPFYYPTISCSVASDILGRRVPAGGDSLHFKEELSLLLGKEAHKEFVEEHHEVTIELNKLLEADLIRETWRSSEVPTKRLDENTLIFDYGNGKQKIKRFYPKNQTYGIIKDTTRALTIEELKAQLTTRMQTYTKETDSDDLFKDQLKLKKMAQPYFPAILNAACPFILIDDPIWLMASVLETDLIADYLVFQTEEYIKHLEWAAEQGYEFVLGGSDIASNSGPILSPECFENIMLTPLKMIAKTCADNKLTYCYRSDGDMWKLMDPIFKKAGIGSFGEVDRDAGMSVAKIRDIYPELIILGNVSSALLHRGSIEQVAEHTRCGLMESKGINYIAGPSNMIMHGTPVENIFAMIDEISKYNNF